MAFEIRLKYFVIAVALTTMGCGVEVDPELEGSVGTEATQSDYAPIPDESLETEVWRLRVEIDRLETQLAASESESKGTNPTHEETDDFVNKREWIEEYKQRVDEIEKELAIRRSGSAAERSDRSKVEPVGGQVVAEDSATAE